MIIFFLISSSILSLVTKSFIDIQSLECAFVETLQLENGTFEFSGKVFIGRDGSRIEVGKPDEQIIIFRGDSVFIYIKKDDRLEKTLAPISLSQLIFSPMEYYYVDSTEGKWTYLSPKDTTFSYPIRVLFSEEYFPRKIRFTQDEVEGRFNFFEYKLNPDIPAGFFSVDSIR